MTLKERAGKYKGNSKVKILLSKVNVSIEVNINENGSVNASYNAGLKKGSTTLNLDPNSQNDNINFNISGMNLHVIFNENKSINITLPDKIDKFKILQTNVTLQRC